MSVQGNPFASAGFFPLFDTTVGGSRGVKMRCRVEIKMGGLGRHRNLNAGVFITHINLSLISILFNIIFP